MDRVRVQTEPFDMAAEVAAVQHGDAGVGAVVSFVGTVRDLSPRSTVSSRSPT